MGCVKRPPQQLNPILPVEYFLVALAESDFSILMRDPDRIDSLAAVGTRIGFGEADTPTCAPALARLPKPACRVPASSGRPGARGDYFVIALPAPAPPIQFGEWDRMARLAAAAERVTLAELDERPIDLRVANVR